MTSINVKIYFKKFKIILSNKWWFFLNIFKDLPHFGSRCQLSSYGFLGLQVLKIRLHSRMYIKFYVLTIMVFELGVLEHLLLKFYTTATSYGLILIHVFNLLSILILNFYNLFCFLLKCQFLWIYEHISFNSYYLIIKINIKKQLISTSWKPLSI